MNKDQKAASQEKPVPWWITGIAFSLISMFLMDIYCYGIDHETFTGKRFAIELVIYAVGGQFYGYITRNIKSKKKNAETA